MSLHSFYQDRIVACQKEIRSLQKKLNGMAVLRLAVFGAFAWTIAALIRHYSGLLLLLTFLSAGVFIFLVNGYLRWKDQRRLVEKRRFVNENELALLDGAPNGFSEGSSWLDNANYLDDLDIFGSRSLFHVLNRTTSSLGDAELSRRLREPLLTPQGIEQQQEAIRVLAPQTDVRQLLTATGLLRRATMQQSAIRENQNGLDKEKLRWWLDTPPRISNRPWLRIAIVGLILVNLYGLYLFFDNGNYTLVIAGIIVSRLLSGVLSPYILAQHQLISQKHSLLDQYAGILAVFNKAGTTGSGILQQLQGQTESAHSAIRRLARLSSYFDQRLNLLVNLVLNTFFFYDLFCMIALERWKIRNRAEFPGWIDTVGTVECLNALATFAFNNPEYAYPVPVAGPGLFIEASRLAHPLIPAARRVANDLTIGRDQRLILVTGSNMSGKTTFLRTAGVNLLMAECGLPVCATAFAFTPMQLLTSLRITDSLQEQTSYFMAELNKLQMIIRHLRSGEPALVLIDEILRGTNSEDKTYGSEQFIRRLLQYPCLSFFATHDLTLGRLEQEMPQEISNYCFESVIEGDELHFDYRLQRGVARNRNASFLMRRMDII
jgi:hypothetical protein